MSDDRHECGGNVDRVHDGWNPEPGVQVRPRPKGVDGDEVVRQLQEHLAVDDGQVPDRSLFGEIERILPVL